MTTASEHSSAHAELMDNVYATQRHIYDLTRKYYLLGRDRAIAVLQPAPDDHVLEIGCGTGRNLVIAAKKYPNVHFYGIDISNEMLTQARKNIAKAGLEDRIHLAQGDAASFDAGALFGIAKFDRVLMSYTLSMIPPWEAAIRQGLMVLNEGGKLVFVDFWNQKDLPGWSKLLLKKWLDLFHVAPREKLEQSATDIAANQNMKCEFTPLYGGYACLGTIS